MCIRDRSRDEGISFTEFSYQLLQAYDFLYLFENYNCSFQMGGSDQWGNIVAGVDLIRKKNPLNKNKAHGITYPLLTTASGEKFGKSIEGAITLDPKVTIPYKLFQYFFNSSDEEVLAYIKLFTDINPEEFKELEKVTSESPYKREAQKFLSKEITRIVHGEIGMNRAIRQTEGLNQGKWELLNEDDYLDLYNSIATRTPVGDLAIGIPTLPITRLAKYHKYQDAVNEFLNGGNSEKLIQVVDLADAQQVYEELVTPWMQVARKSLSEVPESNYKTLLEEVPLSFSNQLISKDKI